MKNNKKIKVAISTAALGTAITTAAVAQACGETPGQGTALENEVLVQTTLINLSNTASLPEEGTSGFNLLSEMLNTLQNTEASIQSITALDLENAMDNLLINTTENSIQISANALRVQTEGGPYETYTNSDSLTLSNIEVTNNILTGITISSGVFTQVASNSEFVQQTFVDLINRVNVDSNSLPTNQNQRELYDNILNSIQNQTSLPIDASPTRILGINISASPEEMRDAIRVSEDASSITIDRNLLFITTNGVGVNLFTNSEENFVLDGLVVSGDRIAITNSDNSVVGLVPTFDPSLLIRGTLQLLANITAEPPMGTNARVFYDVFLTALQDDVDSNITAITGIQIQNPEGFVQLNTDNTVATITTQTITFTVAGSLVSTYSNEAGSISIPGISVDTTTGQITISSPISNGGNIIPQPTNSEILIRDTFLLANLDQIPTSGSALVLWNQLQDTIRMLDGAGSTATIQQIRLQNHFAPTNIVFTNQNANIIGLLQNSIFITTSDALTINNWTNATQELSIANVVIEDDAISSVGVISGLRTFATAESALEAYAGALTGISVSVSNSSVNRLYTVIQSAVRRVANDNSLLITAIDITDPTNNITTTASSITFAQGSLSVTTTSSRVAVYNNAQSDFVIEDITFNFGFDLIQDGATSVSDLTPNPTDQEVIINALSDLSSVSGTNPGGSAGILYAAILAELGTATSIESFSIISPENTIQINENETLAIVAPTAINLTVSDGTTTTPYSNVSAELIIRDIVIASGEITSVGEITGLINTSLPSVFPLLAVDELNGATSRPTGNGGVLWDAIETNIRTSNPEVTNITEVTIDDPVNNVSFVNDQLIFALNSITVRYASFFSPGSFTNRSTLTLDVTQSNGVITVTPPPPGSFEVSLLTNAGQIEFAYNQIISPNSNLANLAGNAAILMNAIDERISMNNNFSVMTRTRVAQLSPGNITNNSIQWNAGNFTYFFTGSDNQNYRARAIGSSVILGNIPISNGVIGAISNTNWTGNFEIVAVS